MITTIKQAKRIFELATEINGTEERKIAGEKPCVFIDYSGHIAVLDVYAYEHGWKKGMDSDKRFYLTLGARHGDNPQECIDYLENLRG